MPVQAALAAPGAPAPCIAPACLTTPAQGITCITAPRLATPCLPTPPLTTAPQGTACITTPNLAATPCDAPVTPSKKPR